MIRNIAATATPGTSPSVVAQLPTAAPSKVLQPRRSQRRDTLVAASCIRFPGKYVSPHRREMLDLATRLRAIKLTPALALACEIYAALDDTTRAKVNVAIAVEIARGSEAHRGAHVILRATRMPLHERQGLAFAMRLLEQEEG